MVAPRDMRVSTIRLPMAVALGTVGVPESEGRGGGHTCGAPEDVGEGETVRGGEASIIREARRRTIRASHSLVGERMA